MVGWLLNGLNMQGSVCFACGGPAGVPPENGAAESSPWALLDMTPLQNLV